jgi:hypothetical protein
MFTFRFGSVPRMVVIVAAATLAVSLPSGAQPHRMTQRRINELAATLLRAHRALIEEPGIRRADERLEAYMSRIAAPLPGETDAHYREREEGYVSAVERAAAYRGLLATRPTLRDRSVANLADWSRAEKVAAALPAAAARVRAAWISDRRGRPGAGETARLAGGLTEAVLLLKTAFEALRDAQP